jgi:hypothetical protein
MQKEHVNNVTFLLGATCDLRYLCTYIIKWEITPPMSISLNIVLNIIPHPQDIELITDQNEKD